MPLFILSLLLKNNFLIDNGPAEWHEQKKIPEPIYIDPGMSLFYPQSLYAGIPVRGKIPAAFQAGLLTCGSFYLPPLPFPKRESGFMRRSSPLTAAGPPPTLTGFPIKHTVRLKFEAIYKLKILWKSTGNFAAAPPFVQQI